MVPVATDDERLCPRRGPRKSSAALKPARFTRAPRDSLEGTLHLLHPFHPLHHETPSRLGLALTQRVLAWQGYFYYFMDVGKAVLACTDPSLAEHAPGPELSWDFDAKS